MKVRFQWWKALLLVYCIFQSVSSEDANDQDEDESENPAQNDEHSEKSNPEESEAASEQGENSPDENESTPEKSDFSPEGNETLQQPGDKNGTLLELPGLIIDQVNATLQQGTPLEINEPLSNLTSDTRDKLTQELNKTLEDPFKFYTDNTDPFNPKSEPEITTTLPPKKVTTTQKPDLKKGKAAKGSQKAKKKGAGKKQFAKSGKGPVVYGESKSTKNTVSHSNAQSSTGTSQTKWTQFGFPFDQPGQDGKQGGQNPFAPPQQPPGSRNPGQNQAQPLDIPAMMAASSRSGFLIPGMFNFHSLQGRKRK